MGCTFRWLLCGMGLLLAACGPELAADNQAQTLPTQTLMLTGGPSATTLILNVEIADEEAERQKGLMFRPQLPEGEGMLFVWPDAGERAFWMKNTLIGLDLLFFNQGRLVATIAHAKPHDETPLNPGVPADWVLEVPAGYALKHNLVPTHTWRAVLQPSSPAATP